MYLSFCFFFFILKESYSGIVTDALPCQERYTYSMYIMYIV